MNATTDTSTFLTDPGFRFTIRTVDGRVLRKLMPASRFLSVRGNYVGAVEPVRVDVVHMDNDGVQTWNIHLTKWFWSN
jgi:hypothetical protein